MGKFDLHIPDLGSSLPSAECRWQATAEAVHDDILLIHNGLPLLRKLEFLANAVPELFAQSRVAAQRVESYEDPQHRGNSQLGLSEQGLPEELAVYHRVLAAVESTFIQVYRELINPFAKVSRCYGYQLLRYRSGEFFDTHVDVVRGHPTYVARQLSVVAFCNDGFSGGELHFPRQQRTLAPEAGAVVLFPSTYTHPHASLPVAAGTKYSVVTWYY